MKPLLLHRRQFIATSGSALTAAALASPLDLTAAADRTWRVAVIGHTKRGDYGHGLDLMWQQIPQTEVVAVADADATGLAAARQRLGGVKGFGDYGAMLAETKPDIVTIAPRHVDQHHAMCLASIAAGARAIYLEKPFCRSPREADDIVAAGTEKNVKIAVAHRSRYHPVLPVIKQLLAAGEIGTLLEIRTRGKEDARGGAQDLWVLGSHLFNLAVLDNQSGIELSSSPEWAGNFRLELGLPGNKTVTILSREQRLTEVTRRSGGITLKWYGPMKDTAGAAQAVAVHMEVQTSGNALEFKRHLDNRTAGKTLSASYPAIGGLAKFGPPGKPADGMLWAPVRGFPSKKVEPPLGKATFGYPGQASISFTCIKADISRTFKNYSFGGDGPEQFFGYRQEMGGPIGGRGLPVTLGEPWIAFQSPTPGPSVYIGAHHPENRAVVDPMRLLPSGTSIRDDGNWPRPYELRGLPSGVEFNFVDCNGGKSGKNLKTGDQTSSTNGTGGSAGACTAMWLRLHNELADPASAKVDLPRATIEADLIRTGNSWSCEVRLLLQTSDML